MHDIFMEKTYFVYIMTSLSGTLYIGVTNDLVRRTYEHREGLEKGFTKKYGCKRLVYFEDTNDVSVALEREKYLKQFNGKRKERLIRTTNPSWSDLWWQIRDS